MLILSYFPSGLCYQHTSVKVKLYQEFLIYCAFHVGTNFLCNFSPFVSVGRIFLAKIIHELFQNFKPIRDLFCYASVRQLISFGYGSLSENH